MQANLESIDPANNVTIVIFLYVDEESDTPVFVYTLWKHSSTSFSLLMSPLPWGFSESKCANINACQLLLWRLLSIDLLCHTRFLAVTFNYSGVHRKKPWLIYSPSAVSCAHVPLVDLHVYEFPMANILICKCIIDLQLSHYLHIRY